MSSNQYPQADPPAPSRRSPAGIPWLGWLSLALALAFIIVLVLLLVGQGGQNPVLAANVQDVMAEPDEYIGERVVVSGRVEEVLTDRALALGSDLAADRVLALVQQSALVNGYALVGTPPMTTGPLYQRGDVVQFLGTLDRFDRESLSEQLDLVLNEDLFGDMANEPVLLVERLDVAMFGGVFPSPAPIADASLAPDETSD